MTAYVARPVMACIDGRHKLCTRNVYTREGAFAGWCPCPCHRRTVPLRDQERQLKADGVKAGKAWAEFLAIGGPRKARTSTNLTYRYDLGTIVSEWERRVRESR